MCSFGWCQTRFEFLSQFRKVRNAFECFVTQVQTRLPKTKCVWPMKINVICTVIANSLENIDWNNLYEMDVDSAYNHFMQIITNIIDQHAPFRQITINPKNIILTPWMTPALLQSSKTFDKLDRKQLKHPRHHGSHLKYIKNRTLYNKLKKNQQRAILCKFIWEI